MKPRALNLSVFLCSPPISAHLCQGSNPLWLIGWIYGDYFFLLFFFFLYLPRDTLKEREMDGYVEKLIFLMMWQSRHQPPPPSPPPLPLSSPHTLLLSRRATLTARTPKWSLKGGTVLTSQSPALFRLRVLLESRAAVTLMKAGLLFSSSLPLNWYSKYSETLFSSAHEEINHSDLWSTLLKYGVYV